MSVNWHSVDTESYLQILYKLNLSGIFVGEKSLATSIGLLWFSLQFIYKLIYSGSLHDFLGRIESIRQFLTR